MKNKALLSTLVFTFSFSLFTFKLHSQWVSIPDSGFGTWIWNYHPTCVQGNNQTGWWMDTTCPGIVNLRFARFNFGGGYEIRNLTGINYFDNLDTITTVGQKLVIVPALPPNLKVLDIDNNDSLASLPPLPNSITYMSIWHCSLTGLPALPANLTYLDCSQNPLGSLPSLPTGLKYLDCRYNQLTGLPALSDSLQDLICIHNSITALPALPAPLRQLSCFYNQLSSLPALPNSLEYLACSNNQLTSIPALSIQLKTLACNNNQITALPALPDSLTFLGFSYNQVSTIPPLPVKLNRIEAHNNQLVSLPALPAGLIHLYCANNLLTSLPALPDSMYGCYVYNNPIACLPELKRIFDFKFANSNVTCLPNYGNITKCDPPLSNFQLCDTSSTINSNSCNAYWKITGKVYMDTVPNCLYDLVEGRVKNVKLRLFENGTLMEEAITTPQGNYTFNAGLSAYEYTIDTVDLPFLISCPDSGFYTSLLSLADSFETGMDFGLSCKPGFDLVAWSITGSRFRPGETRNVDIHVGDNAHFFGVNCAGGVSGTVTVTINGPARYVSPASGALVPANVSGNVITYNIADFGTVDFDSSFNMQVQTDTTAPLGDTICFTVAVSPVVGDNVPANNVETQCFVVRGAYDPNDKQVYPIADIDPNGDGWLTYTVNFQNTGTDTAIHIYITDTLDSDLDVGSFQLLSYSHQPLVQLRENAVRFNFPNINLPDSNINEQLSHGYVQYKIKLKDNLAAGTQIHNTAFIYFDFNAPVITNTTTNTIAILTSAVSIRNPNSEFRIFPNPASDVVTISVDESMIGVTVTVTDVTGRKMAAVTLSTVNGQLSTADFSSGVYFVMLANGEANTTKKLVIQE